MKKKIFITLISSLVVASTLQAGYAFDDAYDFTGEAFFEPPATSAQKVNTEKKSSGHKTLPPVKKVRLKLQREAKYRELINNEYAPTPKDVYSGEVETSQYASKEPVEDFDDETTAPDGFEADEVTIEDSKKEKKSWFARKDKKEEDKKEIIDEDEENIVLECKNVDYDAPNFLVHATGDVSVTFVKQNIIVKADIITFDRMNNTLKAEGNVKIIKSGIITTGEYIFVDLNEENGLIEKPIMRDGSIEIKSEKGYVYGDRLVQEKGKILVDDSFPIEFHSGNRGPQMRRMLVPKYELTEEEIKNNVLKLKASEIKITQKGDLEILSIKKARFQRGDRVIFKTPSVKFYTNKNREFGETNHWEVGSYRGFGVYAGPGYVVELPNASVFKFMPVLNYKSGLGVGAVGRFSSATNHTMLAYGTAMEKFLVYGKQDLDDKLFLHYGMNSYMSEWFLGRRRPKYGVSLVYNDGYYSDNFLIKGKTSSYRHRLEGGYFNDLDFDNNYEKIKGNDLGTTRFRYMAEAAQNLYKYEDKEKLKSLSFDVRGQLATTLYGTGDTQVVARVAPTLHLQYKRWMQDLGFFITAYDDNTPMPVFDSYRYGKQAVYLREYFRICRYLTVSWFGNINVSGDAPNGKDMQENGFYISVGPDDLKFNLGYDFVRQGMRCTLEVMMDAKGSEVEYDKLEIKQTKKAKSSSDKDLEKPSFQSTPQPTVLRRAVVENIKVREDVL